MNLLAFQNCSPNQVSFSGSGGASGGDSQPGNGANLLGGIAPVGLGGVAPAAFQCPAHGRLTCDDMKSTLLYNSASPAAPIYLDNLTSNGTGVASGSMCAAADLSIVGNPALGLDADGLGTSIIGVNLLTFSNSTTSKSLFLNAQAVSSTAHLNSNAIAVVAHSIGELRSVAGGACANAQTIDSINTAGGDTSIYGRLENGVIASITGSVQVSGDSFWAQYVNFSKAPNLNVTNALFTGATLAALQGGSYKLFASSYTNVTGSAAFVPDSRVQLGAAVIGGDLTSPLGAAKEFVGETISVNGNVLA